jgi:predicted amino acid-binding ACT domain protein
MAIISVNIADIANIGCTDALSMLHLVNVESKNENTRMPHTPVKATDFSKKRDSASRKLRQD